MGGGIDDRLHRDRRRRDRGPFRAVSRALSHGTSTNSIKKLRPGG